MPLTDDQLGSILIQLNYLSEEEVKDAKIHAEKSGLNLKTALFDQGVLTQDLYESAIGEYYHLPYYDVKTTQPTPEVVNYMPEEVARTFRTVLVGYAKDAITLVTSDPMRPGLEQVLRYNIGQKKAYWPDGVDVQGKAKTPAKAKKKPQKAPAQYKGKLQFYYAPDSSIETLLVHYRKPLATRFQAIINQRQKVAPEILEEIIKDAIHLHASDIHFEPQEKVVVVRFRVDGVLHEAGRIPKEYYEGVVNRIKIEGNMRTDEHFIAQDGAIRYLKPGVPPHDLRVSIVPIVEGEKIVMRLLAAYVRNITLSDLGFSEQNRRLLEEASFKPFGMVLTTGPTGSGKSTTLYSLLKLRNHPDVNISTIEDPVEYKLEGINHIQVNEKGGLTFASGLRALMRQDPDVILVGEIRDQETASIAVNAALTGHLLFSTLHANDAATAIPRLIDMGVEPFLLASTLEVILSQRLVRRLCPNCRYSTSVTRKEIGVSYPHVMPYFPENEPLLLYRGKGCEECGGTGYKGRIGIHELIVVTPEIEQLIVGHASSTDINAKAEEQGMKHLFEDGFEKVKKGVTSIEELLRVASPQVKAVEESTNSADEKPTKKTTKKKSSSSRARKRSTT